MIGIIDGKGRLRLVMDHHRNQGIRIVRPLHQDDVRPQLLNRPVHMVRAGGTVMADRKQDYLSHFLAS